MSFKIFLVGLLCSLNLWANPLSIRKEILSKLPSKLTSLTSASKKSELKKIFSADIIKEDKDGLYLKGNTTLGIKDEKLSYVFIQADTAIKEKSEGLFQKIYSELPPQQKEEINSKLHSATHEAGRYIKIDLPSEGLMLEFSNNEKKGLHSVTFWQPGGVHP